MKIKLLIFSLLLTHNAFWTQTLETPKAKKVIDSIFLHGDTLIDHYSWMKDKKKPSLINYLYEENAFTDHVMQNTFFLRQELYKELKSRIKEDRESIPIKEDHYYYYSKLSKGQDYAVLYRKKGSLNNKGEVYLNINELAKKFSFFSLTGLSLSPDHEMVAYSVDSRGDEAGTLYVKNIKGDSLLKDKVENVSQFIWAEDNKTILYSVINPKTKKVNKIYSHVLGSSKKDELIYEENRDKFSVGFYKSNSDKYIFISTGSFLSSEVYFTDAKNPSKISLIAKAKNNVIYGVDHYEGNDLIIYTDENAPNGKVLKADLKNLDRAWKTIIEHSDSVTISDYHIFKDFVVIKKLIGGLNQIEIIDRKTGDKFYLNKQKSLKNIGITHYYKYHENKIRYYNTSYTSPIEVRELNLSTLKDTLLRKNKYDWFEEGKYTSKRVWSTSLDGSRVPIDLVYKSDLKISKETPLYMTAYASYGQNTFPSFSSSTVMLLDRGFIYAQAHPRGESLFGKKWHDEGKLLNKINTVTDFISCTEYLHENGYSSPQKTAITGRSAGGMLMGAIVTMRPDLYQAVIPGVPYIDVINGQLDTTMPGTVAHFDEVGNPRIKEHYEAFLKWDPYQNIKNTNYPDILVISGYNDPRVYYWLPTKWVAKMREYKKDSNMLLLKTDMESGHFGSSGRYKSLKEKAFEYAFIFKSLGIKESYKTISGKIIDKNGDIIPFANILIEGTQKGTASNFNGEFSLVVKEDETQRLAISSIGFENKVINLSTLNSDYLKITLEAEDILLKRVTVNANAKDPAYSIIRNAVKKRKFHLNQVESYSANIYLKSNVRLDKIPEKAPFFIKKENLPDSTDLGLIYLSESSSKVHYKAPNKLKEEMYASIVAGMNSGYSFNRTSDVLFNFYKNNIELNGFSDKQFTSPIASSALLLYRYSYEGTIFEGTKQVHKINVRPRVNGDPLFHGFIYINDSTWSIHSLDLMLTKDAQIKFYDTLTFKQEYINVNEIWIPRSLKMSSNLKIFGIGASFNSVGIYSDYSINKEFPKKFFSKAVFRIQDSANSKDSIYWEDNRPMSLTDEERENYYKEDSLSKVYESKEYRDSIRKKDNKITLGDVILGGISLRMKSDSAYFGLGPLTQSVAFNTVEGWNVSPKFYYDKITKKGKRNYFTLNTRYGFENEDWGAKLKANFQLNKMKFERISIEGGKYIDYLNISPFNTWYSLLGKENYLKINQKNFLEVNYKREIFNGFYMYLSSSYESRKYLTNNSSLSWTNNTRPYSDNYPVSSTDIPAMDHDQVTFEIRFKYVFNQQYELHPKKKRLLHNNSPTIFANYKKGIGLTNDETSYDFVSVGVSQKIKLGAAGNFSYNATLGSFINAENIQFWDYKHFAGNQTFFVLPQSNAFETLPYFDFSTNKEYIEIHLLHQFNGFILNKLPLIKKARMQSLTGINSVIVPQGNYYELFFGVENIFNILRVDIAGAIGSNRRFTPSVRVGLDIGL